MIEWNTGQIICEATQVGNLLCTSVHEVFSVCLLKELAVSLTDGNLLGCQRNRFHF